MRLYVGGIPYKTTKEELIQLFGEFGEVTDVHLPLNDDRQPRGFAFVEIADEGGPMAIDKLNGTDFGGRRLTVNEAQPKQARPDRGGFGGGDRPRFNREDRGDRGGMREERAPREEMPAAPAMPEEDMAMEMPGEDAMAMDDSKADDSDEMAA